MVRVGGGGGDGMVEAKGFVLVLEQEVYLWFVCVKIGCGRGWRCSAQGTTT